MNQRELLDWAIKGLLAEIEEHERQVRRGQKYLNDIRNGKPVKTPKTEVEIIEIINKKNELIEELSRKKSVLEWIRDVELNEN